MIHLSFYFYIESHNEVMKVQLVEKNKQFNDAQFKSN